MQTTISQPSTPSLSELTASVPGKMMLGLSATAVVAAAAHVAIPLPFTPVPLTLQPLAVLGVGLALGPVAGFLTMVAYLVEGAAGLPVFAPTGMGGLAQLFGPTGGFLMVYPLVAAIVGGLAQTLSRRLPRFTAATIAGAVAVAVLFAAGASWLGVYGHMWSHQPLTLHQLWIAAVLPFLPGEAAKVLVAAGIYSGLGKSSRS